VIDTQLASRLRLFLSAIVLGEDGAQRYFLDMTDESVQDPILRSTVWQRSFANPIGCAAGFDVRPLVSLCLSIDMPVSVC
jgi:hypothetical protein